MPYTLRSYRRFPLMLVHSKAKARSGISLVVTAVTPAIFPYIYQGKELYKGGQIERDGLGHRGAPTTNLEGSPSWTRMIAT